MIINPYAFGGASSSYLDSLATTPRMALGLKKLISTATTCFRIRRDSDNAEQDIGFSGDTYDSSALSSFVGAASGYIVTLYDQTGNGENATQSTAANQPRLVNAGSVQSAITFDNTNDHLIVTSLTMGSAYCGIYMKGTIPAQSANVDVMLEMSTNYNNNAQSWVFYNDAAAPLGTKVSSRNSTSVNDFRLQSFGSGVQNSAGQATILMDRSTTGTNEIQMWFNGSAQTATAAGTPADQTGVYNAYDLYIGGRVSGSLYSSLSLHSLAIYNADSSSIRTSVEGVVA